MNPIKFYEPNFRCKVSKKIDQKKQQHWLLAYAESENKVRDLFINRGFEVYDIKPYNFQDWKDKTERELLKATKAIKRGERWKFKPYWNVLKSHLQNLFNYKCAYCESFFGHVAFGDVEHFRPKGDVDEEDNHPGYYWLAYEPTNYLPSCQLCNQGTAKKNKFPIAGPGKRAYSKDDPLEEEKPLLLNPYYDIFPEHINFMPSQEIENAGWATGKTKKGKKSIEVLELNRHDLINARTREMDSIRLRVKQAFVMDNPGTLNEILEDCVSGIREFSCAAIAEIRDYYKKFNLEPPF